MAFSIPIAPAFAFRPFALDSEYMEPLPGEPDPSGGTPGPGCGTQTSPKQDTASRQRLAPLYRVLIHNDAVTTMEFVVLVLERVFKKDTRAAIEIMMTAHNTGVALVAVLPLEQAELRVDQAHSLARTEKFPLTFTYEPE
jgi:ATP-dependent Clp protease adaptor protein ClpS